MYRSLTSRTWLGALTALIVLCVFATPALAQTKEAAAVVKTTPQVSFGRDWQSWPPSRYDRDWPRVRPKITQLEDGARFSWLAADYEVRIDDGWLELWQGFGGQSGLILRTFADEYPGVTLLRHPWRGPQLVFFEQGHILKVIYPVNYYTFQEAWLSQNVDPDSWSALAIARSGPVMFFMRGPQRVLAWYNGIGYHVMVHDALFSSKDDAALAVNNAGEAVLAWTELGRLNVQWMSDTFGWKSEQLRDYRSGNAWELVDDPQDGLVLRYETSRDVVEKSVDAQVLELWW